ncbi:hypothetical protein ABZP36_008913 [Zizania latifolia]
MAQSHPHAMAALAFFFLLLLSGAPGTRAQQPYGSEVADCPNQHNATGLLGYFCSRGSSTPSCQSYLTFHARPPYSDLASIATLLGVDVDAASLAAANSASSATAALAAGTKGLSTCQAVQEQGLGGAPPTTLLAGQNVTVPLRCACPSVAQRAAGVRYLVTYLVDEFDELGALAARFGVNVENISAANEMTGDTIYPFTTLLIPVKSQPNISQLRSPQPPPPPPPPPAPTKKRAKHTGVYVGIGVAVAVLAVVASAVAALALRARRRRTSGAVAAAGSASANKYGKGNGKVSPVVTGGQVSVSISKAFPSLSDIKSSLKVFTYAELTAATDHFSTDRRVGGSVYRAVFNGDAAAVEVLDRDVSDLDNGNNDVALRRMEQFLDPAMAAAGSCPVEAVGMMVRLIERCVRRHAGGRPGMGEVAQHLLMLHGVSGDGWHSSLEHYRSSGGNSSEQP